MSTQVISLLRLAPLVLHGTAYFYWENANDNTDFLIIWLCYDSDEYNTVRFLPLHWVNHRKLDSFWALHPVFCSRNPQSRTSCLKSNHGCRRFVVTLSAESRKRTEIHSPLFQYRFLLFSVHTHAEHEVVVCAAQSGFNFYTSIKENNTGILPDCFKGI